MPGKTRPQSSAVRLGVRFDALVLELRRQGKGVDEIAEDPEIKTLFLKFKNPKAIIQDRLKARIREAIQKDKDRQTGERNQVSIPGILDEEQHYEFAEEVIDNEKILAALLATCKRVRGEVNNNKLFFPEERIAIFEGVQQAEELFRRRLG